MIVILDYDMGNVGSIKNILHAIGEDDVTISDVGFMKKDNGFVID